MLRNNLKIAWRNLTQSKGYSALTILGLALGLAACTLSVLYVQDELSYDQFNLNVDRIYRVNGLLTSGGKSTEIAVAPTPMGQTLKQDFPEVEAATRLGKSGSQLVKSKEVAIREQKILYADSTVFEVFTLPMLAGNPKKALADPQSVVITESMAKKYFGTESALNQTLVFDNKEVRKVTGVILDIPAQSHFEADFLLPLYETQNAKAAKWGNHIFNTYVLLRPGSNPALLDAKFEQIVQTYLDPALQRYFQTTLAKTRKAGNDFGYSLMPLSEIHLYSNREGELAPNNSISSVVMFVLIGVFILLIAVFNFINLTTARSAKRSREIGVRKVMGSNRNVLVFQFLSESMLTTVLALVVGIVMLYLLLPGFNSLAAKQLNVSNLISISGIACLLGGTAIVGILAGIYPAFFLSAFKPISALKGIASTGNRSQMLRTTLVVLQFSISVLLIIGTLLVNQQLRYIQSQRVGFDKEQVVIVKTALVDRSGIQVFKNEVLRNPGIGSGAVSGFLPVVSNRWNDMWFAENETDERNSINMQEWMVDPDYLTTFSLKLVAGRNFRESSTSDQESVIINQSAAKRLGYKNPIGKTMHKPGGELLTIIGVVQDFHYESLRDKIQPLVMVINGGMLSSSIEKAFPEAVSFKLNTTDFPPVIKAMEATWKQLYPGLAFEYSFLNEDFDAMYRSEQRIQKLFATFAFTAIFIACLGLFGLSAFAAERRTKEIGVRKVLGASVISVVVQLSKDFVKPVLMAITLAIPLGWYGMSRWLEGFAYKIEIQWWVFVLAGVLAIVIALLTVSFQSVKAALMNPVKSLKSE
ncbi:ABC transporter permease [Dyadobacter sp. CY312]|uniref:ABC transporter permease n=1 Tax=Dyadobacter sp. CY312 TaxID=2907303 RepID=UPI001F1AED16|nr:ABC transporter permease [Dyadobacter sp. CY312]MCE7040607.1 ABC transporter permease [Dyadobacter sp. CY312]